MTAAVPATPCVGVLMLESRFPRPEGDIGNPRSWPCPTLYRTVAGAGVRQVASNAPLSPTLIARFVEAARALEADGADIVTTSCGFLADIQPQLAGAIGVPVVTSSLLLLPELHARLGPQRPLGVITFDARALACRGLVRTRGPVLVEGLAPDGELCRVIADDLPRLDTARARADVLRAAHALKSRAPDLAAIVLECTNLGPYRQAVAEATGVPVYDLRDAVLGRSRRPAPGGANLESRSAMLDA